jgi:hypothetical protein
LPASESKDDIAAFIKSGAYKSGPWVPDSPTPRESHMFSQHPSKVRVFMNQTAITSAKEGRTGELAKPPLDQWSMLVKEMYDLEGANMVGVAVALKTLAGSARDGWTFFCYGPDSRCTSRVTSDADNPIHGHGNASPTTACMDCHGGMILTPLPQ